MEHSILKGLLNKDFYEATKAKCKEDLFTKDLRKIKQVIDNAIENYQSDLDVEEVKALFFTANPTLTTSQKHQFDLHFQKIKACKPMNLQVANDVLSNLNRQHVGELVANLGFQYVNGVVTSLEPLKDIIKSYNDDFLPQTRVDFFDNDLDSLVTAADADTKWKLNIQTLHNAIPGLNNGMLFVIGARSNVGKSSFHATLCASPHGWAQQGANVLVLCNEEHPRRVASRYMTAATGMTLHQIKNNKQQAHNLYDPIRNNIKFVDATGKTMAWAESVIKNYKPDIVVMDIGSKFSDEGASTNNHEALKANAIYARNIGKLYNCLVVYCTQLSAEAEGKIILNQGMIEGSKTGLAGESDLMILIARNPPMNDQTEDDRMRHLNIVKNKISGVHNIINCEFDYQTGQYTS